MELFTKKIYETHRKIDKQLLKLFLVAACYGELTRIQFVKFMLNMREIIEFRQMLLSTFFFVARCVCVFDIVQLQLAILLAVGDTEVCVCVCVFVCVSLAVVCLMF